MRKTILVVEDFATTRRFICAILEARGYHPQGAASVREAWDILSNVNDEINLVLADYHMPDESGLDLLQAMKAHQSTKYIPVIFLTSESDVKKINEAFSLGLHDWVVKPYRASVLFKAIDAALSLALKNN